MSSLNQNNEDLIQFIDNICNLSSEREWVEFKLNHQSPQKIGEYISALANSACFYEAPEAYLIFGIKDDNHEIIGTTFDHRAMKGKGAEALEPWLLRNLNPKTEFSIKTVNHQKGRVVIFFIPPAHSGPVKFIEKSWIRIDSSTKPLSEFPEKEAVIWDRRRSFEDRIAKENVSELEVLKLLNYEKYFQLTKQIIQSDSGAVVDIFLQEGFLIKKGGNLHISNLGAISLGRDLEKFSKLKNKSVRVITYHGKNKLKAMHDVVFSCGYAVIFDELIAYIKSQIPKYEKIVDPSKIIRIGYPAEALIEFVANALIHQDFYITGTSPLIEIFDDRIEIYNPGNPLIKTDRFIDKPPRSRNEKLADVLRRFKICEKRGAGVDRAIFSIELAKLPAPNIEAQKESVKVTMYSKKGVGLLTEKEKCRACYFHSCIKYVVEQEPMTNSSLCQRLEIKQDNKALASRIISATLKLKLIKLFDPENKSSRYAKYVPYWTS